MDLLKRLNGSGFERLSRKRHLVARDLSLTDPEFRLWSLLVSLYAWFEGNQETYGKVEATNRGLAALLPKSEWSATKVNNNLKTLLQKGLITRTGRSEYEINLSVVQQNISPVKQIVSPTEQFVSLVKQELPQKEVSAFSSSKASSSLRSDEEYQKMWEEGGKSSSFTIEDMKLADSILAENGWKEDDRLEEAVETFTKPI
ncbi:MAG: hypothetical protein Q8P13_00650 [bacterium]|nr:hypothetical protein [bacterium]